MIKNGKILRMQLGGIPPRQSDYPDYESYSAAQEAYLNSLPTTQPNNNQALWHQEDEFNDGLATNQSINKTNVSTTLTTTLYKPITFNPYVSLRGATAGLSWLSGIAERGRQNQYMQEQYSQLGQIDPVPVQNFQPNPYNLYAMKGGKLQKGGKLIQQTEVPSYLHMGYQMDPNNSNRYIKTTKDQNSSSSPKASDVEWKAFLASEKGKQWQASQINRDTVYTKPKVQVPVQTQNQMNGKDAHLVYAENNKPSFMFKYGLSNAEGQQGTDTNMMVQYVDELYGKPTGNQFPVDRSYFDNNIIKNTNRNHNPQALDSIKKAYEANYMTKFKKGGLIKNGKLNKKFDKGGVTKKYENYLINKLNPWKVLRNARDLVQRFNMEKEATLPSVIIKKKKGGKFLRR